MQVYRRAWQALLVSPELGCIRDTTEENLMKLLATAVRLLPFNMEGERKRPAQHLLKHRTFR
jgi:hypothetical protein